MDGQAATVNPNGEGRRKRCICCGSYISSLLIASIEIQTASLSFLAYYAVCFGTLSQNWMNDKILFHLASFYITLICLQFSSAVLAVILLVSTFKRERYLVRIWCYYTAVSLTCDALLLLLTGIWEEAFPVQIVYTVCRTYFIFLVWHFFKELRIEASHMKLYSRTELLKMSSLLNMSPQIRKAIGTSTLPPDYVIPLGGSVGPDSL